MTWLWSRLATFAVMQSNCTSTRYSLVRFSFVCHGRICLLGVLNKCVHMCVFSPHCGCPTSLCGAALALTLALYFLERALIHHVDPINTALRWRITIHGRVYHVNGPNSLWHIDGHHRLIKWRFFVHGGIDGFSRTVVYLRCSTNNEASTVLASFIEAVSKYGLPDQVIQIVVAKMYKYGSTCWNSKTQNLLY